MSTGVEIDIFLRRCRMSSEATIRELHSRSLIERKEDVVGNIFYSYPRRRLIILMVHSVYGAGARRIDVDEFVFVSEKARRILLQTR